MKTKTNNTTSNATCTITRGNFVLLAKFLPVTNHRPCRIKVTRSDTKQSITVSWSYEGEDSLNYDRAVQAWVAKFNREGWLNDYGFIRGYIPTGYTFTALKNR